MDWLEGGAVKVAKLRFVSVSLRAVAGLPIGRLRGCRRAAVLSRPHELGIGDIELTVLHFLVLNWTHLSPI